ncbi:MAG: hypothetical protein ACKVII_12860 [Planctomycetales bacterium]
MSVFANHAAELIRDGHAIKLDDALREILDVRVNEVPWMGPHVAWHEIPGTVRFDWGQESDAATAEFVRALSIGHHSQLCAFYGTAYPVLSFDADWLFNNLDLAAANTQQYFLFGHDNGEVALTTFAELETGSTIWGWAG